MAKKQSDKFDFETTPRVWEIIQAEGKFRFNEDGDPARPVDIVLSDYHVAVVPPEERQWSSDAEKATKAGTTVLLKFERKKGA